MPSSAVAQSVAPTAQYATFTNNLNDSSIGYSDLDDDDDDSDDDTDDDGGDSVESHDDDSDKDDGEPIHMPNWLRGCYWKMTSHLNPITLIGLSERVPTKRPSRAAPRNHQTQC